MNKKEIIRAIANEEGLTLVQTERIVNRVFETVVDCVEKGEEVEIWGFGKFKPTKKEARTGRNPQNGQAMLLPARKGIKFSVSKTLKDRLK